MIDNEFVSTIRDDLPFGVCEGDMVEIDLTSDDYGHFVAGSSVRATVREFKVIDAIAGAVCSWMDDTIESYLWFDLRHIVQVLSGERDLCAVYDGHHIDVPPAVKGAWRMPMTVGGLMLGSMLVYISPVYDGDDVSRLAICVATVSIGVEDEVIPTKAEVMMKAFNALGNALCGNPTKRDVHEILLYTLGDAPPPTDQGGKIGATLGIYEEEIGVEDVCLDYNEEAEVRAMPDGYVWVVGIEIENNGDGMTVMLPNER